MERRRFERFVEDVPVAVSWQGQVYDAVTKDLSISGARLLCGAPAQVGSLVSVALMIPEPTARTLKLDAQVRWAENGALGLFFPRLRPDDLWVLMNFLGLRLRRAPQGD